MLLGSTALDVAIGLVFVYLVVSLICSAFSEGIESVLRNRSQYLERGIRELLIDTTAGVAPDEAFIQKFYNHPLISALFKADYATAKTKRELPAYIPSPNFALAIMDIVGSKGSASKESGTLDATRDPGTPAPEVPPNPLNQLRSSAVALAAENPKLSRALVSLIDAAGGDANRARKNIEAWFDGSMDRVSGWYKHRAQKVLFALGLIFSAAANLDSVAIIRCLSTDGGVRDALIAQAKVDSQHNSASTESVEALRRLGLPIGWDKQNSGSVPARDDPNGWAMKVVGILLTGLAVTLGAPFWFDVLNRFIVIRSTVKPSEKSKAEESKA
jgi:hypothetical protein